MKKVVKPHHRRKISKKVRDYGEDIFSKDGFLQSNKSMQHGDISVMEHSIGVAKCALAISEKIPIKVKERDLVRGALLHDYFQYDWHNKKINVKEILRFYNMHGFTHPTTALHNAKKDFTLSKREEDIIKKHMWPLTVKPPLCREAWIVTIADKYCSFLETVHIRKSKKKQYVHVNTRKGNKK